MIYRIALRMLGNDQAAEDVAREALVAAWRQLPSVRCDAGYPTGLLQIVICRALNYSSPARATSLTLNGDVTSAAEPAPEAARGLAADAVTAAVAALPPPQRVAIVLHRFEGLPSREIARITGSTDPAVRSHMRREGALAEALAAWPCHERTMPRS
jgi:RNA polymerase sigma-70 factor (ECF subfamily)